MKNVQIGKRLFAAVCFLFVFVGMALAQQTIKGTVFGSDDEPILGANVLEKGTTNGTVTDMDGEFALSVKKRLPWSSATLVTNPRR